MKTRKIHHGKEDIIAKQKWLRALWQIHQVPKDISKFKPWRYSKAGMILLYFRKILVLNDKIGSLHGTGHNIRLPQDYHTLWWHKTNRGVRNPLDLLPLTPNQLSSKSGDGTTREQAKLGISIILWGRELHICSEEGCYAVKNSQCKKRHWNTVWYSWAFL